MLSILLYMHEASRRGQAVSAHVLSRVGIMDYMDYGQNHVVCMISLRVPRRTRRHSTRVGFLVTDSPEGRRRSEEQTCFFRMAAIPTCPVRTRMSLVQAKVRRRQPARPKLLDETRGVAGRFDHRCGVSSNWGLPGWCNKRSSCPATCTHPLKPYTVQALIMLADTFAAIR